MFVPPSPPANSYIETQCDGKMGAFGECLGHEGKALISRISVLIKEA